MKYARIAVFKCGSRITIRGDDDDVLAARQAVHEQRECPSCRFMEGTATPEEIDILRSNIFKDVVSETFRARLQQIARSN